MKPIMEVRGLVRRFGDFTAVKGVHFDVMPGEIFGYLGANGAGKSTTIRMLCGLLAPSEGSALVAGHSVSTERELIKARIGYMSQKFSLYLDLSVRHNLEFFGGAYGVHGTKLRGRVSAMANALELSDLLPLRTGDLPGGQRQRVALACSLLHEPDIVFLDEPTAGVGPGSRRDFWTLIRRLAGSGVTVFVTTHYMDEAEFCDRVGIMVAGELVALDTPAGLKQTYVRGQKLALRARGLRSVTALRAVSGVAEAELFGEGAEVILEERIALDDALRTALRSAVKNDGGGELLIEPALPNLEDVFIAVVDGGPLGAAEASP
ncbi:MAG: ABC transporter ATP-binding protein [Myxococcota bacterium]